MKGRLVCGKESRKQARKRKKCGEKILEKNEMTLEYLQVSHY